MNLQNLCPQCGTPNASELNCSQCGAVLPSNSESETSSAPRLPFWRFALQFILALAALVFNVLVLYAAYVLATGAAKNQDVGDMSGLVWLVGIVALICGAICLFFAWRLKKK